MIKYIMCELKHNAEEFIQGAIQKDKEITYFFKTNERKQKTN